MFYMDGGSAGWNKVLGDQWNGRHVRQQARPSTCLLICPLLEINQRHTMVAEVLPLIGSITRDGREGRVGALSPIPEPWYC